MPRPLLISHDLSFSGAPLAFLALGRSLRRLGYEPAVLPMRGGPLHAHFEEAGIPVVGEINLADISFVIANTVVSLPMAALAKGNGLRTAVWLHESLYYLNLLNVDLAQSQIDKLDLIMVPAQFQIGEYGAKVSGPPFAQLRNTVTQPNFRPTAADPGFAVTGGWEPRKGQLHLLNLIVASGVRCPLNFIGVTAPENIPLPSGMPLHFSGHIPPEAAKRAIAAAPGVISCAEAEVQPLSTLEAILAGRPALLSDIDAHRALAKQFRNVFLFDRNAPESFKAGFEAFSAVVDDEAGGAANAALGRDLYGEATFDARLRELVEFLVSGSGAPAAVQD
jgi:glycosyltransferase involved in cell wall biosynthesis